MIKRVGRIIFEYLPKVSWVLFLLFLPVTSFPYFPPAVGGSALVRPLSLYPLIILIVLVTIPHLLRKPIYPTILTLIPFILAVFLSTLVSFLADIHPILNISLPERTVRAMITLGVGVGIYLTVTFVPKTLNDLRHSLQWLYAGIALALFWGSLQAVYVVHFYRPYYRWLNRIQNHISIRRLFQTRVSGLTYEPNWFAEQITFLLLPWLLASVLTGHSVFRWRWRWLTVEFVLLIWSIVVLVFTFSRTGILNLAILGFVSLLFLRNVPKVTHIGKRLTLSGRTRRILEAGLVLMILVGFVYMAGKNNEFFARIWNYWSDKKKNSLMGYIEYLGFGARLSYGEAALNIFEAKPVLGVGLGNYAFYFEEYLPDRSIAGLPEILRLVAPEMGRNRLVTPKNFYLRILSETGLVGLGAFLVFLLAVLGCAIFLWLTQDRHSDARFLGTAGILGVLSFSVAAITYDSFAIPNMWVIFGLITASTWIIYRSRYGKKHETYLEDDLQFTSSNSALPTGDDL